MSALGTALVAATTPAPSPTASLPQNVAPDPNSVTPGLLGFLVVFVLAIVLWLLLRNLTGRLRRMRFREEERLAREAAESAPGTQPRADPGSGARGGRRS